MTADVGYFAAFLGGLLALLSPCSALLLPAFFAYSIDSASRLVARTGIFYAGLATTLVPLGAAGSYAGRLFYGHRDALVLGAGWLIIGLGVAQIVGLGFASRRISALSGRIRPTTALSVYALGAVYGLAGFCAGPILGSVLTVAAVSGSPAYGGLLLAVYALGMAVPLFLLALLWERFDLGRMGVAARPCPAARPLRAAHHDAAVGPLLHRPRRAVPRVRRDDGVARAAERGPVVRRRAVGPRHRRARAGRGAAGGGGGCGAARPRGAVRAAPGPGRRGPHEHRRAGGRLTRRRPRPSDGAFGWWLGPGSNRRPIAFQAIARTN